MSRRQTKVPATPSKQKAKERMARVNAMPKLKRQWTPGRLSSLPASMRVKQAATPISADKVAALQKALNLRLGH